MDLSPYQFKAPFDAFEFGTFHQQARSSLLIICNGWLFSPQDQDCSEDDITSTQQYWALRLKPMIGSNANVLICNRTGTERGMRS
jgi:protein N-terminal amidase